jgi:hypothetical protein
VWFGGVRPTIFLGFNMSVEVFKDGVSFLVEPEHLKGYLDNGYFLEEDPCRLNLNAKIDEMATASAEYEAKFGEKPHHKMKLETILEKLNGD